AEAMHKFLYVDRAVAVREDDRVTATTLLAQGGPYARAAAQVALEGNTYTLRQFAAITQHEAARLDHDHTTHISAIRAAIARAAKVAATAHEEAARASEAAAIARKAAAEATEWADRAKGYAAEATDSAKEARNNAQAAEASAADAARSAATADKAAAAARDARNVASQAVTRAVRAAENAAAHAANAQASANAARRAELEAGKDAHEAVSAAAEAKFLVLQAAIREAARKARENATAPPSPGNQDLPGAAEACLTPFDDPIPSGNHHNPYELGWNWLTDKGSGSQCFGPNDEFTRLYRESGYTRKVIDKMREKTRNDTYKLGETLKNNYELGGWMAPGKYTIDQASILSGGRIGNLAYAFLGSHYVRYTPIRKNADGSVVWRYTAYNETVASSGLRDPILGYFDWYKDSVGRTLDKAAGRSGPLSPKVQVIEFNVTVSP